MPRIISVRRTTAAGLLLLAAACGGSDAAEELSQVANAESVDQESSATVTEEEQSDFTPPADGVLTPRQVDAFLRTSLVQFDLIRQEAPRYHQKVAQMEQRGEKGGLIAGLRNAADAGSVLIGFGDLVGGSYVRSARSQGMNPAEMEWVRERMMEVSGHLMMLPVYQQNIDLAAAMKTQAEQYRGQAGFSEEQVQEMIRTAEEQERQAREQMNAAAGPVTRNLEVLRRTKPNVTNHMWGMISLATGTSGVFGLHGLAEPGDTTAARQMNEWRRVYTDALANQVTPGLEATVPAGEARVRVAEQPAS